MVATAAVIDDVWVRLAGTWRHIIKSSGESGRDGVITDPVMASNSQLVRRNLRSKVGRPSPEHPRCTHRWLPRPWMEPRRIQLSSYPACRLRHPFRRLMPRVRTPHNCLTLNCVPMECARVPTSPPWAAGSGPEDPFGTMWPTRGAHLLTTPHTCYQTCLPPPGNQPTSIASAESLRFNRPRHCLFFLLILLETRDKHPSRACSRPTPSVMESGSLAWVGAAPASS